MQGQAETPFTTTTGWFGTDTTKFGTSHRQEVTFDRPDDPGPRTTATAARSTSPPRATTGRDSRAHRRHAVDGRVVRNPQIPDSDWNSDDTSGEGLSH